MTATPRMRGSYEVSPVVGSADAPDQLRNVSKGSPTKTGRIDHLASGFSAGHHRSMKRKNTKLDADFWRRDAEMKRMLEERIAYHKAKIAEEREKR